ncbi:MAG: AarF/ABC1/UbiB kinase family protein [Flavobacteriaceae bacterium]|nr:AarF/ABC1/UbiB kinase family protein [Flavobacteriaceae bacterium]
MSFLPAHLERYRKFFSFLIKYWNSDIVTYTSSKAMGEVSIEDTHEYDQEPEEFAEDLKQMGPTYIKLGQLLSTRPDLLPDAYLKVLTGLQDDIDPISAEDIHQIIEEELGVRISKAFAEFDDTPIANASIGQVHAAVLHSGKKVAVKVQRPAIRERFLADLDTLQEMADWAHKHSEGAKKYNVSDLVEELRYTLLKELDYTVEAQNLIALANNLQKFEHLFVPQPILDYSSSRVLTMEYVEGKKVTKVSPLRRMEINLEPLVDDLIEGYLQQVVVDGFAHADPHPGNVHITPQNRLALMDLGMVARFSKELQDEILQLLIGLSNYNSEQVIHVLLSISQYDQEKATVETFKKGIARLVLENQNRATQQMETGRIIIQMNRIAAHNGIQLPVALNMLAKILLNMDQIVAGLAPKYDVNKTIRRYVHQLMHSKMVDELKPENLFNVVLESKKLAEKMPERLNAILENLAANRLKIKVDAIDEQRFTDAFQKVANRITLGLIIAALIIGAALLMQIPTTWILFGYPALAIILFLSAALLGFYIVYGILFKDQDFNNKK